MQTSNLLIILLAEALLVSVLALLMLGARRRRQLNELKGEIQALKLAESPRPLTYPEIIDQQLMLTREYHQHLGKGGDIAMDLDPAAPPERHCAALRHAFLIAEREAAAKSDEEIDWQRLHGRYQQLLAFDREYRTPGESVDSPG